MVVQNTQRQFLRFALIGTVAFVIDAGMLIVARDVFGFGLYTGRLCSFLLAVTFTWALNRRFTFVAAQATPSGKQWAKFVAANSIGAGVNYGVYALLVGFVPLVNTWPVLGVAAGSVAGLVFNFSASKAWVFDRAPGGTAQR